MLSFFYIFLQLAAAYTACQVWKYLGSVLDLFVKLVNMESFGNDGVFHFMVEKENSNCSVTDIHFQIWDKKLF